MNDSGKLDLLRPEDNANVTPMFNSIKKAEQEMKKRGIKKYNVCKTEADTF